MTNTHTHTIFINLSENMRKLCLLMTLLCDIIHIFRKTSTKKTKTTTKIVL